MSPLWSSGYLCKFIISKIALNRSRHKEAVI